MKEASLFLIEFYRRFISIILKMSLGTSHFCRYNPTCSEYAKSVIMQYGLVKGGMMAILRVLSCQPISLNGAKHKVKDCLAKVRITE